MILAKQLHYAFDSRSRILGFQYLREGRVTIAHQTGQCFKCKVRGSEGSVYLVSLEWMPGVPELKVACSCPHYEKGNLCKHLWAVILLFDQEGLGRFLPAGNLEIVDTSPDMSELEAADDELDEWVGKLRKPSPWRGGTTSRKSRWTEKLERIELSSRPPLSISEISRQGQAKKVIWYIIETQSSFSQEPLSLHIKFWQRVKTKTGWGKLKPFRFNAAEIRFLDSEPDREVLSRLIAVTPQAFSIPYGSPRQDFEGVTLAAGASSTFLPHLEATGRFGYFTDDILQTVDTFVPISFDARSPYQFELSIVECGKSHEVKGHLLRKEERREIRDVIAVFRDGFVLFKDCLTRIDNPQAAGWIKAFQDDPLLVPKAQQTALLKRLASLPYLPPLRLPESFGYTVNHLDPTPILCFERRYSGNGDRLKASLSFRYGKEELDILSGPAAVIDSKARTWTSRNQAFETILTNKLAENGFHLFARFGERPSFELSRRDFFSKVEQFIEMGFEVRMEKRELRPMRSFSSKITSGLDWFDLSGKADFGAGAVDLPVILKAMRKGESFVILNDGSQGMIPPDWQEKWLPLLSLSHEFEGELRFKNSQAALLDVWLLENQQTSWDEKFAEVLARIKAKSSPSAPQFPKTFQGQLRPYQHEGYSWLLHLKDLQLGGCLADDMGLGKTIQVLALLENERLSRAKSALPPSLVVVPRSLVFNWIKEASRFTPELSVAEYQRNAKYDPNSVDLLIITYGMLRDHIATLKEIRFHYVILDEAQVIKNPGSGVAKATRLLQASHRLVMTGTPVENHPSDLWSLFEFLNPGMLGSHGGFQSLLTGSRRSVAEIAESKDVLRRIGEGLRPFILRRSKEAVLKELPAKTEQVIYCELEPHERQVYDQLRDYYRLFLDQRIREEGWNRSQIIVLEALLRLRQSACHPKLVQTDYEPPGSTKMRVLIDQLREVLESGHKALVFSQFTSFLALLRSEIEKENIPYEYLDGSTRNREERVKRFQEDPTCQLFLLSLKAGGVGLNLTAADYVFLLDPWWNPAAEAQAIDRAHRIGQSRPVIAYRLIAKDTIEERILELQSHKLKISKALIFSEEGVPKKLTAEDLFFLLE